jgi:hypothetical protein
MSKSALEAFLIRLAVDPAFAERWLAAQPAKGAKGDDDRRMAILDGVKGLDETDKQVLLRGTATEIEGRIFAGDNVASSQHTVASSQHTVASSQHTVASSQHTIAPQFTAPAGAFKITITVESK